MTIKAYSRLEDLPPAYLRLFEECGAYGYNYSLPWYQNFVRTALDVGDEVCIYGVERNGEPDSALAALVTRFNRRSGAMFYPATLSALSNYYNISFGPHCNPSDPDSQTAVFELAQGISSDPRGWDVVNLYPLDCTAPVFDLLVQSFRSAGMVVQTYFCFGNWYLEVGGHSYEEYFKALPSAMQNTLRRKAKKLEKSGRARIELVTSAGDFGPAIEAYEKVYSVSWKVPEPYPQFMRGLIRTLGEKGWLRLGTVYFDDQPIAAQVWIVHAGHATIYKLAHDMRFDEYSAGSLLTARMLEHVIDVDRIQEIDFGNGDDPYKKNWLPYRRERWGIMAFNPRRVKGCLSILRHIGGRAVKSHLKGWLGKIRQERAANPPSGSEGVERVSRPCFWIVATSGTPLVAHARAAESC